MVQQYLYDDVDTYELHLQRLEILNSQNSTILIGGIFETSKSTNTQ